MNCVPFEQLHARWASQRLASLGCIPRRAWQQLSCDEAHSSQIVRQVKRDTLFVALTSRQQPATPMLSTIAMAQAAEQQTRRCQFAAHGMQGEACLLFPAIALKSPWGRACCARPHGLHRVMSLVVGADGGPCGCGRCWSCGKVVKSYLGGRDRILTRSKLLQRVSVL